MQYVDDFGKISDSGYFLHLIDLILNDNLSEEEYEMIDSFDVKYGLDIALETINIMEKLHRKKSIISI